MKNIHNIPIPPLNWQAPKLAEGSVSKSTSHAQRLDAHYRMGTPPTRRGAFNGYESALRPNPLAAELSPELYLNDAPIAKSQAETPALDSAARTAALDRAFAKAMGLPNVQHRPEQQQPMMGMPPMGQGGPPQAGQGMPPQGQPPQGMPPQGMPPQGMPPGPPQGMSPQGQPPQGQPPQGMPPQGQPPGPPQAGQEQPPQGQPGQAQAGQAPKVPGLNQMAPEPQMMQQMPGQQPMAMTPQGAPIYPDPFHPAHSQFGSPEHQMAAMQHQQAGQMAEGPQVAQHTQAAQAHGEMAQDNQSPMERGAEKYGQQGEQTPPSGPSGGPPQNFGKPSAPPQAKDMQDNPAAPEQAMQGGQGPSLNSPKPPPAAQMQSHPGNPPMGTPQGQPPMGSQDGHGYPDQGKPQAPPQPEGMPRQGPKPGMAERSAGTQIGAAGGEGKPALDPAAAADLFQQWLAGMMPAQGPDAGSSSTQEPMGMPKPPQQVGANAPPTHAASRVVPEPTAQKSLNSILGW